jgi:hypothetical protein
MSSPGEYDPRGGGPANPPNVYHPRGDASPVYEAYADPAVAHGWLNAYDETRELPPVPDVAEGPRRHRGARRKPSGRRPRRAAVAAGAVGAVSAMAAAIALSLSGSPSGSRPDGVQSKDGRQGPTAGDSPGAPSSSGSATDRPSTGASEPSVGTSPGPTASSAASAPAGDDSTQQPSGSAATPAPTTTAGTTGRGNSGGNPGRGQGATKRPK